MTDQDQTILYPGRLVSRLSVVAVGLELTSGPLREGLASVPHAPHDLGMVNILFREWMGTMRSLCGVFRWRSGAENDQERERGRAR